MKTQSDINKQCKAVCYIELSFQADKPFLFKVALQKASNMNSGQMNAFSEKNDQNNGFPQLKRKMD